MVANRKVTGNAASMPTGIGIGVALSLLVTVLGCAALAGLIGSERLPESALGYGAMVILVLSAVTGSAAAVMLIKHRRLMVCMVLGICYFGILLLINGLMFGGAVSGVGVTALLILGGCGAVALIGSKPEGKGSRRTRKIRTG